MIKLANLLERKASEASKEAKKLGLTYYGFSGYGKDNKVTHRSVGGKLHAIVSPTDVTDKDRAAQYGDEEQRTGEEGDDLPPTKIPDEAPRDDFDTPGEEPVHVDQFHKFDPEEFHQWAKEVSRLAPGVKSTPAELKKMFVYGGLPPEHAADFLKNKSLAGTQPAGGFAKHHPAPDAEVKIGVINDRMTEVLDEMEELQRQLSDSYVSDDDDDNYQETFELKEQLLELTAELQALHIEKHQLKKSIGITD